MNFLNDIWAKIRSYLIKLDDPENVAKGCAALIGVFLVFWFFGKTEITGQIGDSFGVITSFLTFCALMVLLKTFRLQQDELKKAVGFMSEQNEMGRRQLTLNIIFQLCEQYREIMDGTTFRMPNGKGFLGREGLEAALTCMEEEVFVYQKGSSAQFDYIHFTAKVQTQFSKYAMCFRLLHRIFKFIENETSNEKARQEYARIPRAMLSDAELEALLINCLTDRGDGMKKYIEKYKILNNYEPCIFSVNAATVLCKYYKPEAFGDNPFYARAVKGEKPPE